MEQLELYPYEPQERICGQPITGVFLQGTSQIHKVGGDLQGDTFIYLIHLSAPISRAHHYLGSTIDLERRIREHHRKYPRFVFSDYVLTRIAQDFPDLIESLRPLCNKTFRRYHTLDAALFRCLPLEAYNQHLFTIQRYAKQYTSNGIVMAANRRGIPWELAKVWQADRGLEFRLKAQKNIKRFCPICQGDFLIPF